MISTYKRNRWQIHTQQPVPGHACMKLLCVCARAGLPWSSITACGASEAYGLECRSMPCRSPTTPQVAEKGTDGNDLAVISYVIGK